MSRWMVTWPAQVSSGKPPEEYLTESRAAMRAADLVATGHPFATVYETADEEMSA